jgi:GrpB-like predicted nucleotidyltransferase (UPF0157 family)
MMNAQESLLAAIHAKVELHEYDPAWPASYAAERERLLSLLPDVFIDLEHIGSTAVPRLCAKPIIDILAGVESMDMAEASAELICLSGYTTSADFNKTLTDRKWFMRFANGHRTHHLHVVVHESKAWFERLHFRDALRSQPELAARYAALKSQLAALHPKDREAYTDAKAEFVRSVSEDAPLTSNIKSGFPIKSSGRNVP